MLQHGQTLNTKPHERSWMPMKEVGHKKVLYDSILQDKYNETLIYIQQIQILFHSYISEVVVTMIL